jgi:transcription-repair coupling factor (superfamily II helicase)
MRTNITGISGSRIACFAARNMENRKKALIIVSTRRTAERLRDDLSFFSQKNIYLMPEEEEIQALYEARDTAALTERIRALWALTSDDDAVVIAPVSAVLKPSESRERFVSSVIELEIGKRIEPAELRERLVLAGYEASQVTESRGEFSSRGGIMDIFPPNSDDPVRVEFFDDEIDSIRSFDPVSQRSVENMISVSIAPAVEFMPTEAERKKALGRILKEYDRRIEKLAAERDEKNLKDGRIERLQELRGRLEEMFTGLTNLQVFAEYLDYFGVEKSYLWEYMVDGTVMVCDPSRTVETIPEFEKKEDFYSVYDYDGDVIIFTPFPERLKGCGQLDSVVNVKSRQVAPFNGQMDLFASEVAAQLKRGYEVRLVSSSQERSDRLREFLDEQDVHGDIFYMTGDLSAGMVLEDEKKCIITERDIFPNIKKSAKRKRKRRKDQLEFSDLHKGDYVVHEEHGIGRFEGIKTLEADGEVKDYLKIHYAGSDVLYIPTDQLDIIQRYIGNEGNAPKLSKLSGGDWHRTRAKARKAIEEIASDLVDLYAEREMGGGYAFSEDTVWQKEFEDDFPYNETDDQLKAIEEIKEDMEKPLPMDRLLCGDVGYGKTEVAARAIFKCISEGKQAVLLAPTTLLANQHYHTLKERFSKFPFEVEMLSRFVDEGRQKKILEGMANGTVDFVIGTHRLLSNDVKFNDLGLLVIDEEQRFGVKHKEKIKKLRKNVDVLTLSATPIPRTLSMSLSGIKNISMIEEPPEDRYPVQTFVTPQDDTLMAEVIQRELSRGGQVYVICSRVKGINDVAEHIRHLAPGAVVDVGHGRMDESNLENVMIRFDEGETDILVATTIVENGIDIANANTMIILNADRFGLAQLYQLRGRVGRSDRIAYAYLMYQPQRVLTETARKRLAAIREFTEFGAGFKLAMRDLEIRGSGNVLGEAQHGHISGIGYELYVKEIDRAVRRLKGERVPEKRAEIAIEADIPARIPQEYIQDESLRLQAYKKIAQIRTREDAEDVVNELIDRFGDPPEVTIDLIAVSEVKSIAEKFGVEKVTVRGGRLVIEFAPDNDADAYTLIMTKQKFGSDMVIGGGSNPAVSLRIGSERTAQRLLELMTAMEDASEQDRGA